MVSFSRSQATLDALAAACGARAGTPAEAAAHGEVIIVSVPWAAVDTALAQAGGADALAGKAVIDTTNQFDLYGEEFHRDEAIAAVRRLRGTLPAGTGRP